MKSHELAKLLLSNPDMEITASLDIESGVYDDSGDEYISKIFGYSLVDLIVSSGESTLHFEVSGSGWNNIDVLEAVHYAQMEEVGSK